LKTANIIDTEPLARREEAEEKYKDAAYGCNILKTPQKTAGSTKTTKAMTLKSKNKH